MNHVNQKMNHATMSIENLDPTSTIVLSFQFVSKFLFSLVICIVQVDVLQMFSMYLNTSLVQCVFYKLNWVVDSKHVAWMIEVGVTLWRGGMGRDSNGERQVHKQILWILAMYQQHTSLDGLMGEYIEVISLVNAMKNKHMDTCKSYGICCY